MLSICVAPRRQHRNCAIFLILNAEDKKNIRKRFQNVIAEKLQVPVVNMFDETIKEGWMNAAVLFDASGQMRWLGVEIKSVGNCKREKVGRERLGRL